MEIETYEQILREVVDGVEIFSDRELGKNTGIMAKKPNPRLLDALCAEMLDERTLVDESLRICDGVVEPIPAYATTNASDVLMDAMPVFSQLMKVCHPDAMAPEDNLPDWWVADFFKTGARVIHPSRHTATAMAFVIWKLVEGESDEAR